MYYIRRITPILAGIFALVVIGAVGFLAIYQFKTQASIIVNDSLPDLTCAGEINSYQAEGFIRTLLVVTADSPEERAVYLKEVAGITQKNDRTIQRYANLIRTEDERRTFDKFVVDRKNYQIIRNQVFALVSNNQRDAARKLLKSSLWPAYEKYTKTGDELFDLSIEEGNASGQKILGVCTTTQILVAIIGIAIFIGGFLTPFFMIRFSGSASEVAR